MYNLLMMNKIARHARCICYNTVKSSEDLAFFTYRGPGSLYATNVCENCGYNASAHRNIITHRSLICSSFESKSSGHEFDSYYCGCRGWD